MKIRSYNKELALSSILFSKLFRNIVINRKLANGKIEACKVTCVIGTRSRILKAFENGQEPAQFTLPMISITRTAIARDPSRLSNLHNEIKWSTNKTINYDLYSPNPINIDYKVTIYAKYMADIDMILSNFVIFFNDDLWVSAEHPKYLNLKYYSQIVMHNNINETRNESLANTELDVVTAECTFTFKTFLFGGSRKVPLGTYTVNKPVTAVTEITVIGDDGQPVIDPDTGNISTITTQVTGINTEIYDGYIPKITGLQIELHNVPKYDPFRWAKDGTRINYDFLQYFEDVDSPNDSERHYANPEYDYLEWHIDTEQPEIIDPETNETVPNLVLSWNNTHSI